MNKIKEYKVNFVSKDNLLVTFYVLADSVEDAKRKLKLAIGDCKYKLTCLE